jgi:hypothetical protein
LEVVCAIFISQPLWHYYASTTAHKWQNYDEHHRRVSGLAEINFFFLKKCQIFFLKIIFFFEVLKFKEIPREGRNTKVDGN